MTTTAFYPSSSRFDYPDDRCRAELVQRADFVVRKTWSAPSPLKVDSNSEIVVSSGDAPISPLSYHSAYPAGDVSAASAVSTDVSGRSSVSTSSSRYHETALVVRPENALAYRHEDSNPSTLPPRVLKMKKNRRRVTVGAGVVGGVVGLVALGPVGGVVGGIGTAMVVKHIGKRREKKKLQKLADQEIARQCENAPEIEVFSGEFS